MAGMWVFVVALIVVLAIVAGILGVVLMGMQGRYRDRAPKLAHRFAQVAKHVNGDGELPAEVVDRLPRRPIPH